jgi:hypothetical protein
MEQPIDKRIRHFVAEMNKEANETKRPFYDVLDMEPLYQRPDAHPSSAGRIANDCLHYCFPGPVSHLFSRLMMQKLFNNEWR